MKARKAQIKEGVMKDLHSMMDNAKDEKAFLEKVFKSTNLKKTVNSIEWMRDLYADYKGKTESVNEAKWWSIIKHTKAGTEWYTGSDWSLDQEAAKRYKDIKTPSKEAKKVGGMVHVMGESINEAVNIKAVLKTAMTAVKKLGYPTKLQKFYLDSLALEYKRDKNNFSKNYSGWDVDDFEEDARNYFLDKNSVIKKKVTEALLAEGKGADLATKYVAKLRQEFKKLSDDDLDEFRKAIAMAFDLKESVNEKIKDTSKPAVGDYISLSGKNRGGSGRIIKIDDKFIYTDHMVGRNINGVHYRYKYKLQLKNFFKHFKPTQTADGWFQETRTKFKPLPVGESVNEASLPKKGSIVKLQPSINLISFLDIKDQDLEVIGYKKTGLIGGPSEFLIVKDAKGKKHEINPEYIQESVNEDFQIVMPEFILTLIATSPLLVLIWLIVEMLVDNLTGRIDTKVKNRLSPMGWIKILKKYIINKKVTNIANKYLKDPEIKSMLDAVKNKEVKSYKLANLLSKKMNSSDKSYMRDQVNYGFGKISGRGKFGAGKATADTMLKPESVNEGSMNATKMVKIFKNKADWGDTIDQVYVKGGNLVYIDSFFYGQDKALNSLVKSWSKGGDNYKYFKDTYGIDIDIVDTFSEFKATGRHKKLTDTGIVGVVLKISGGSDTPINEATPPTDATIKPHMNTYTVADDPYEVAVELGKKYNWNTAQIAKAEKLIRKKYIMDSVTEATKLTNAHAKKIQAALEKAGLKGKTSVIPDKDTVIVSYTAYKDRSKVGQAVENLGYTYDNDGRFTNRPKVFGAANVDGQSANWMSFIKESVNEGIGKNELKKMIKLAAKGGARGYDIIKSLASDLSKSEDAVISDLEKYNLIGLTGVKEDFAKDYGIAMKKAMSGDDRLLAQMFLSSAEYQKAKKMKGFDAKDWKWDSKKDLYRYQDIDESVNEGKPAIADTYKKIKDFNVKALTGFARKVGLPSDVIRDIKDTESGVDEIMGHLYDDNWLIDLMKQGVIESVNEGRKYEEVKWIAPTKTFDYFGTKKTVKKGDKGKIIAPERPGQYLVDFQDMRFYAMDGHQVKKTGNSITESVNEGIKLNKWSYVGTITGGGRNNLVFTSGKQRYYAIPTDDEYDDWKSGGSLKKKIEHKLANSGRVMTKAEYDKIIKPGALSQYLSQGGRIWDHVESKKLPEGIELGKVFTGFGKSFKKD